ncbi:MAG: TonB-dependent receptor [Acidobacteriaceae bacterium]
MKLHQVLGFALIGILLCGRGLAQNGNAGDIRGTVTDKAGAVIAGTTVTLLETTRGISKAVTTDKSGIYDSGSILPGKYTITFENPGFETLVRSGIILDVGATTVNAKLSVGAVTQHVVVNGEGTLLQTDTSEQTTTLGFKTMNDLTNMNTNGPSWSGLIQTLPGVNGFFNPGPDQVVATINGTMPEEQGVLSDGGLITQQQSSNYDEGVFENVAEVKVDSSTFSAEYGIGGVVINQISKGGTNSFHGAAYEYIQNDLFNAAGYFSPNSTVPFERFNNWGGAIGGPILKNKLFFYFNYDHLHNSNETFPFATFPTVAMRAGDFSDTTVFAPIYNPYTANSSGARQPLPGNKVPQGLMDTVAQNVQGYFPIPTLPGTYNNWQGKVINTNPWTRYFGRGDYDITQNNRVMMTVTEQTNPTFNGSPDVIDDLIGNGVAWQGLIDDTWTFSSTANNEFRMFYNRQVAGYSSNTFDQGYPQKLGINYAKANIFPNVYIGGSQGFGGTDIGGAGQTEALYAQNTFEPSDVVTLIRGKHILKFGGEFLDLQANTTPWGYIQSANLGFTGYYTQQAPFSSTTGEGYADFLMGQVNNWSVNNGLMTGMRSKLPQAFVQDDIKLKPNLTINLGLRFEHQGAWTEVLNRLGSFDPNLTNPTTQTLGAMWFAPNGGRKGIEDSVNNFLPRVGFSWQPTPKLAVRGGFGLYTYLWTGDRYFNGAPGMGTSSSGGLTDFAQISPVFLLDSSNPPLNYVQASRASDGYNGQNVNYDPVHTPVPIERQYTLSVQRQLNDITVAEVAYVGNVTQNLSFPVDYNQIPASQLGPNGTPPYPQFLNIGGDKFNGSSNYNSLQASVQRQYRNDLTYNVNYTWSKLMDDQDMAGGGGNAGPQPYQHAYHPALNYGPSNYDITNALKISFVYQLPVGVGHRWLNHQGVLNSVLGGWQVSSIIVKQSGLPYTVTVGSANETGAQGGSWYPNVVGNPHLSHPTIHEWFNPAAFAIPAPYTFGNSTRNSLRGPGLTGVDMTVAKNIPFTALGEPMNMMLRIDALNVFNHTVFGNPDAQIGTSGAGQISGTQIGPRTIQVGARFSF